MVGIGSSSGGAVTRGVGGRRVGPVNPTSQAPQPSPAQPPTEVLNYLKNMGPVGQVPPINNTSTPNPNVTDVTNTLSERAKGDMGAADAMRLSTVGIRDAASGLMKELGGNRARRGVSGTGVDSIQDAGVASDAMRQIAGANSKIAFDSERAKDAQLFGIGNLSLGHDASQRQDRSLALDQYNSANTAALNQQRLQLEKMNSVLSLLSGRGMF